LNGATIHTEDSCTIVISNGGTQTFHLRATSEVERQRWVTELELAKAREIGHTNTGKCSKDIKIYIIIFFTFSLSFFSYTILWLDYLIIVKLLA